MNEQQLIKLLESAEGTIARLMLEVNRLSKEIESLKEKLENLPMSLKDDIEYWSEKRTCNKCNDTGWVCEWHPNKEAHKCCGGAGMPCECTKGER